MVFAFELPKYKLFPEKDTLTMYFPLSKSKSKLARPASSVKADLNNTTLPSNVNN